MVCHKAHIRMLQSAVHCCPVSSRIGLESDDVITGAQTCFEHQCDVITGAQTQSTSDDVKLVGKLGFSTRQDSRTVQIVRLSGPDTNQIKINFGTADVWPLCSPIGFSTSSPFQQAEGLENRRSKGEDTVYLKGNSHQILLSEMSLPGVEVLIEKLLREILLSSGKENPSKRLCKVTFVQRKCTVALSDLVRILYATYN